MSLFSTGFGSRLRRRALRIGEDLRTVQLGWPMGMPLVRSLGDGLYEVRTDIPNGIARLLFFQSLQTLVIVEGFIKKSRKTPKTELDNAIKRKKEYESHLRAQRTRSANPPRRR